MRKRREASERYYQTISRFFFHQRGAPFFLSSREVMAISEWEEAGVPLDVVIEGIRACFESRRQREGKGRRISLTTCRPFVRQAFEAHRERRVGAGRKASRETDKRELLGQAAAEFLASCPAEFEKIRTIYARVLKDIRGIPEGELESLEKQVERLLAARTPESEKQEVWRTVLREHGGKDEEEKRRIFERILVRRMRERHRVPRLPLYYY
ncbi:MAG: hypothetical protein ACE5LV_09415 [Candidatus Aminicenantales bacterium]